MATNPYFNHFKQSTEQNLVESLTIEAIKMYGVDMVYLPRDSVERDELFGEDIITKFDDNYAIEMYVETTDGFEGGQDVLAKFGLQIVDQATFVLSKRRFEQTVGTKRPMEGDLIYFPLSNSIFEVNHVEHENPFYQTGKLFTYKLTVELFTYSHEEFNTGLDEIDRISDERSDDVVIDNADNVEIQEAADEVLDKSNTGGDYPNTSFDTFDPSNPFGDI